jgi:WD40 repeat protein
MIPSLAALACLVPAARGAEPGLPEGALVRMGSPAFWHSPKAVAWQRDGKLLFSAAANGEVRCWEAATGRKVRSFGPPPGDEDWYDQLVGMNCSPDGRRVATVQYGGMIHLWDATEGKLLGKLEGKGAGHEVLFTADSRTMITAYGEGAIHYWSSADGKRIDEYQAPGRVRFADISADGKTLAFGCTTRDGNRVIVLDVTGKKIVKELPFPANRLGRLAVSPDGKWVALPGKDFGTVRILEVGTGRTVADLPRHPRIGDPRTLRFSPDGKTLAVSSNLMVTALHSLRGGAAQVAEVGVTICFSPDGKMLVGLALEGVGRWDIPARKLLPVDRHRGSVGAVGLTADGGTVVSLGRDGTVRHWDIGTGEQKKLFKVGMTRSLGRHLMTPDAKVLACDAGDHLEVWDAVAGRQLLTVPGSPGPRGRVTAGHISHLSADGRRLFIQQGDRLVCWDPKGRACLGQVCTLPKEASYVVGGLPDAKVLISICRSKQRNTPGRGVILLDMARKGAASTVARDEPVFRGEARFSPQGDLLGISHPKKGLGLYDPKTGKEIRRLSGFSRSVFTFAFSPDGKTLVCRMSSDAIIRVRDVQSGANLGFFRGESLARQMLFTADGRKLVTGSLGGTLTVWDMTSLRKPPPPGADPEPLADPEPTAGPAAPGEGDDEDF